MAYSNLGSPSSLLCGREFAIRPSTPTIGAVGDFLEWGGTGSPKLGWMSEMNGKLFSGKDLILELPWGASGFPDSRPAPIIDEGGACPTW